VIAGRHYDVIVLGRSLGCLLAAALLARRDFSVLVLGQGQLPATYKLGATTLRRRTFSLLGASSPALRRALVELAQSQTFKRKTVSLDPMFSVVQPVRRYEVPPDLERFGREVDREFPEVRRVVDDLYGTLARVNDAMDTVVGTDAELPPGGFWERRRVAQALAGVPFLGLPVGTDILGDFPQFHAYRAVVDASVAFASDLATHNRPLPPLAVARLHGSWTRGVVTLPGGEDELTQFLTDRITAHGGTLALDERAEQLMVQRDGVAGVLVEGDVVRTGGRFVLSSTTGEELAELAKGQGLLARAQRDWPRVTATVGRFIVSLVVAREGLPEAMGFETFLFPQAAGSAVDPRQPVVRLCRTEDPSAPGSDGPFTTLVAETLLPLRGALSVLDAREAVLSSIRRYFPFLERHLSVVDSPHDGLSVWVYENGQRREVDRVHLRGSGIRAEPMEMQLDVHPLSFHDLAGEPVRGPIERTLLLGKSVLPTLGQEGELIAAWTAARIVTKSDPRREKLRLEMWNRVEIG
jgi:hypothetical protein